MSAYRIFRCMSVQTASVSVNLPSCSPFLLSGSRVPQRGKHYSRQYVVSESLPRNLSMSTALGKRKGRDTQDEGEEKTHGCVVERILHALIYLKQIQSDSVCVKSPVHRDLDRLEDALLRPRPRAFRVRSSRAGNRGLEGCRLCRFRHSRGRRDGH